MLILRGHTDAVRCLSYSPDGRFLASGSEDRTVRLWDLAGQTATVLKHESSVEALAFSPSGDPLATGTAVGEMLNWDVARRRRRSQVQAHIGGVRGLAFAPDGETIATTGWDRGTALWERSSLKILFEVAESSSMAAFTLTPRSGVFLALGGDDGGIRLFQIPDAVLLHTLPGYSPIYCLAWSPDGQLLAAGHADGTIALWEDTQLYATLSGHTWTVYALAFTPDGRTLISGSADGTVRLWDVAGGRQRRSYRWHTSWVTCVAVAADGMTAAAGSADHSVVIWDLDD